MSKNCLAQKMWQMLQRKRVGCFGFEYDLVTCHKYVLWSEGERFLTYLREGTMF